LTRPRNGAGVVRMRRFRQNDRASTPRTLPPAAYPGNGY